MTVGHFDVVIVGAGLSGIGAAVHLQTNCPGRTYTILEGRAAIGGTWDLFRYPGIRSDSDMYTLGYSFKPWTDAKAIADGPAIRSYICEAAHEHGIDPKIRFGHQVTSADWSTADARWTVVANQAGEVRRFTCNFIFMCSGYYDYAGGYTPDFPGASQFKGDIVQPQFWPEALDYSGKRVVIIGSGATAVTLVPEMAKTAAHVTMLQRSPTYVVSRPAEDAFANRLRRWLPPMLAYGITRWKNVLLGMWFYGLTRRKPKLVKERIIAMVQAALGPDYDVGKHFTPRYNVWDQRLCLVPDADLFEAIKSGRASVTTDTIKSFTPTGIELDSGTIIDADVIVTATGLKLQLLSGLVVSIDGVTTDIGKSLAYKGMMYSGVPNLASSFGYTNASWTLKCDLTCEYVCRLLDHMERTGLRQVTPRRNDPTVTEEPWLDFSSGYVQRSIAAFPKQGNKAPWKLHQNYARDIITLKLGALDDGVLEFSNPVSAQPRIAA